MSSHQILFCLLSCIFHGFNLLDSLYHSHLLNCFSPANSRIFIQGKINRILSGALKIGLRTDSQQQHMVVINVLNVYEKCPCVLMSGFLLGQILVRVIQC